MKTAFKIKSEHEVPVKITTAQDLDPLMEKIGDSKFVLLGEASHGTHEYYVWRTEITKRLIKEKSFSFIAVEGDWPDCYKINRFIKGYKNAGITISGVLTSFNRWPTWMWANWEIAALTEWLREHNKTVHHNRQAGFYGLDIYSLWESMNHIINYLEKTDPPSAQIAKEAIRCFEPYEDDGVNYGRAAARFEISCKDEVVKMLQTILEKSIIEDEDPESSFSNQQNAFVAVDAEKYYRSMIAFGPDSWNIRDRHMADTLNRLMQFHGPDSKAIVWEHNTHIGDARATDMKNEGMWNVGQLVREEHDKEGVVLVGFGSYEGTVIAGSKWGAPMQVMQVPPALPGSVEHLLHRESEADRLLLFQQDNYKQLRKVIPHRAIGVVYHPERERHGNYVPTVLPERYDAFFYLNTTIALHPIHMKPDGHKTPETYPFGF